MSKPKPPPAVPDLTSIDPDALAQVTGGTSDSSALIKQLNGLLDSVKQIRSTSQANGIDPQEMMLFMMLMQRSNGTWYVR